MKAELFPRRLLEQLSSPRPALDGPSCEDEGFRGFAALADGYFSNNYAKQHMR
jgi:hypothetical protein